MSKIHPLKNSKYKYPFGEIILATNVASFNNYPPIDIPIIDIGKSECMFADPTMAIENIEIAKKRTYIYIFIFNKHFQNNWGMKLSWVEFVLNLDG
jgi:hypothetical protein